MKKFLFCVMVLLASVASAKTVKQFDSYGVTYSFQYAGHYYIQYIDTTDNKILVLEVNQETYESIEQSKKVDYRIIGELESMDENRPYELRTENWNDYVNK